MRLVYIAVLALFLGLTALAFVTFTRKDKTAFVYNAKVFDKFEGTNYLLGKLSAQKQANKVVLDSLIQMMESGRKDLEEVYNERASAFSAIESQASEQYTAEIWEFINDGIKEYGDENGYDFIFGASGDGHLMYAQKNLDLTESVIEYLNAKYDDKPLK